MSGPTSRVYCIRRVIFVGAFDLVLESPLGELFTFETKIVECPVHIVDAEMVPSGYPPVLFVPEFEFMVQIVDIVFAVDFLDEPGRELFLVRRVSVDILSVGVKPKSLICHERSNFVIQIR